jgi:hypothetical protein
MSQPCSLSIKRQRIGTTCPCIERSGQGIFRLCGAALEGKNSIEDLLLVLNFKGLCGEKIQVRLRYGPPTVVDGKDCER